VRRIPSVLPYLIAEAAVLVLAAVRAGSQEPEAAELAAALPRLPPCEPEEALARFRLLKGLRIELVAAEPDVIDPVAAAFDEEGRLFAVEMRDYPFSLDEQSLTRSELAQRQPGGRLRLLEDTTGDGRMDRSRVFLDGLSWPTAVACSRGGVYVAAAPDIIYARDTGGDGRADERRVVFTGFGRHNVQSLVNGLKWGPDHRLYGLGGGNGGAIKTVGRDDLPAVEVRGRDFRFAPGGPFEAIAGSGGQFGLAFDDWGNRLVSSNSDHIRHAVIDGRYLDRNPHLSSPAAASIAVDGGAAPVFRTSPPEPWRVVRTRWRAASTEASRYAATELVPAGFFTSATGILIFRGDALGEELRGNAFVGDVGGNLVHRKLLEPAGATFIARRPPGDERSEFLTSSDNWFRPVQLAEGPDGALYIIDMYRECIEHPYSIPESIKGHLDLTSGNDRGRIYRITREGKPPPRRPPPGRLELDLLIRELESPNAWRRETAARLIAERGPAAAPAALRKLLETSPAPAARFQALFTLEALGELGEDDLLRGLEHPHQAVRGAAVRLAEGRLQSSERLRRRVLELASNAEPRLRFQVTLSLGEAEGPEAMRALAELALADGSDPWCRNALLSSAKENAAALLALLAAEESLPLAGAPELLRQLAAMAGAAGGENALPEALRALEQLDGPRRDLRLPLLEGLASGLRRRGSSLARLLEAPALEHAATRLEPLFEEAASRAARKTEREKDRLAGIRLLAFASPEKAAAALAPLLSAAEPPAVQLEAVRSISALDGALPAPLLLDAWPRLGPSVRREVLEALFRRPERLEALLQAIARGAIGAAELDPARRKQLLDHPAEPIRKLAKSLLDLPASGSRSAVVEGYRDALLLAGDAARGAEVFRRACATCHRAAGAGHQVGPDLETVRDRSAEELLTFILDPNREVAPAYAVYTAVTADQRLFSGILVAETASNITLRRAEGAEDTIPRSSLLELQASGQSIMPEDLEKTLSPQDLADVIEYSRSLGR
jgi:putative membrane-bound dehydrogenase-like protein